MSSESWEEVADCGAAAAKSPRFAAEVTCTEEGPSWVLSNSRAVFAALGCNEKVGLT